MKAAQESVSANELNEVRDAYEDALIRLSHFIECIGAGRGWEPSIAGKAERRGCREGDRKRPDGLAGAILHPKHPERICWGCERCCPSKDLACREERVPHPIEPYAYAAESTDLQLVRDIPCAVSKASAARACELG